VSAGLAPAVVTDSTSDVSVAWAQRFGIEVVPLFVNFGDVRFRDEVDLSRDDFYARLGAGGVLPTTSQPTSAMFEDVFRPHVEAGRDIVSVHIAQELSGTINAARAAAEQFPGARIELIDSRTTSGGLALLAIRAGQLAQAGCDTDGVVAALARDIAGEAGFVALPDLSHPVRTGRVSRAQAAIGGLLKIVPVLRFGRGAVDIEARVRTFARAQETLVESALKMLGDVARSRIIVIHAHALEGGRALQANLRARLPCAPEFLELAEAGPAIAAHSGQGALAIFAVSGA
jgi:DegV family protein with EDD domain